MKKTFYIFASLILIFSTLTGCNEEDKFIEDSIISLDKNSEIILPSIIIEKYINSKREHTRLNKDFSLSSFDYQGKTVMYIANYDEGGFDIFSADSHAPMILFSSETGSFYPADTTQMSDSFEKLFLETAEKIYNVSFSDKPIDDSWTFYNNSYAIIEDDSSIDFEYSIPDSEINNGYWLIDTIIVSRKKDIVPHLVQQHWGQNSPYNNYIKYITNNSIRKHGYVGCNSVATGQYLHYMYMKDGHTPPIYASASYDSINNEYIFCNKTNAIWNQITNNINYQSLLLGYISKSISLTTDSTGTYSNMSHVSSFLNDSCGLSSTVGYFDINYIQNNIQNGYPVITAAYGYHGNKYNGHCFLIDGCYTQESIIAQRLRWFERVNEGQTGDKNKDTFVNNYVEYKPIREIEEPYFQMNWGWANVNNYDMVWYNASSTWYIEDDFYYDNHSQIIKVEY